MALSKKRVEKLPKCNFCDKPAKFDAPTRPRGTWAFMCDADYIKHGMPNIGTKLIEGIAEPVGGEAIDGILEMDRSIAEDMLIIICPECKDEKHLELDANGTYPCDGCGHTVNIPTLI